MSSSVKWGQQEYLSQRRVRIPRACSRCLPGQTVARMFITQQHAASLAGLAQGHGGLCCQPSELGGGRPRGSQGGAAWSPGGPPPHGSFPLHGPRCPVLGGSSLERQEQAGTEREGFGGPEKQRQSRAVSSSGKTAALTFVGGSGSYLLGLWMLLVPALRNSWAAHLSHGRHSSSRTLMVPAACGAACSLPAESSSPTRCSRRVGAGMADMYPA